MGCGGSKKPVLPLKTPVQQQPQQQQQQQQHEGPPLDPRADDVEENRFPDGVVSLVMASSSHPRRGDGVPPTIPLTVLPVSLPPGSGSALLPLPSSPDNVINYRQPQEGSTALISAIKRGDLTAIEELIRKTPACVNTPGLWGNTPAILSAQYDRQDILTILLDHGADVVTANEAGATPLLFACMEGFPPAMVSRLIAQGAAVDPPPAKVYNTKVDAHARLTPLLAAATNGFLDVAQVLLDAGAQIDRAVLPTVTFSANYAAELEPIPKPEAGTNVDPPVSGSGTSSPTERRGVTALMAAASNGHDAVVHLLIGRGADPCLVDALGNTCLLQAALLARSSTIMTSILHSSGATTTAVLVNRANTMLVTPLHAAAENGWREGVAALVAAGADLDAKTRNRETPLMRAVGKGDVNLHVVRHLVESGASLTDTDEKGRTALDLAISKGRRTANIRQFLEEGGSPPSAVSSATAAATPAA